MYIILLTKPNKYMINMHNFTNLKKYMINMHNFTNLIVQINDINA